MTCAVKGCGSPHERSRVLCTNCVHSARALVGQSLSTCGICGSGPPEPGRVYCTACAIAWTPLAASRDPNVCRWCLANAGSLPYYTSAGPVRMCTACNVQSAHARAAVNVNGVLHASSVAALPSAAPAQAPPSVSCEVPACGSPANPGLVFCATHAASLRGTPPTNLCGVCATSQREFGRALCATCAVRVTPAAAGVNPRVCRWCLTMTCGVGSAGITTVNGIALLICSTCLLAVRGLPLLAHNGALVIAPTPVPPAPTAPPPKPRTKPSRARPAAPVTRYQIKLLPSGAWVGWLEHGLQPVTSAQALRFDDAADAAAWALEKLRGRMCVVEPVEVVL